MGERTIGLPARAWLRGVKVTTVSLQSGRLYILLSSTLALAVAAEPLGIVVLSVGLPLTNVGSVTTALAGNLLDGLGAGPVCLGGVGALVETTRVVNVLALSLNLWVCGGARLGIPDISLGRLETTVVARSGRELAGRALGACCLSGCLCDWGLVVCASDTGRLSASGLGFCSLCIA